MEGESGTGCSEVADARQLAATRQRQGPGAKPPGPHPTQLPRSSQDLSSMVQSSLSVHILSFRAQAMVTFSNSPTSPIMSCLHALAISDVASFFCGAGNGKGRVGGWTSCVRESGMDSSNQGTGRTGGAGDAGATVERLLGRTHEALAEHEVGAQGCGGLAAGAHRAHLAASGELQGGWRKREG